MAEPARRNPAAAMPSAPPAVPARSAAASRVRRTVARGAGTPAACRGTCARGVGPCRRVRRRGRRRLVPARAEQRRLGAREKALESGRAFRRPLRARCGRRRAVSDRGDCRHPERRACSPTPATSPRSRRSTTTRRAPSRASTPSGGELVGEFAVQRRLIVGYDDIAPQLRQAIIAAEDGDFNTHFGLSISHIIAAVSRDILRAAADVAAGRKTSRPAGASTLTQQLARTLFPQAVGFSIGDLSLERKIKEAIVAVQIEKRYTKRRDPDLLREPHAPRPRHLRRRGRRAHVLRQVGEGCVARRGRDARRHLPVARPAEPVRQRGRRHGPAELRAAADGRRRVHHAGRGGHGQEAAHRRAGPTAAGQVDRAVLPRGGAPAPRAAVRGEGAVRGRAVGHHDARRDAAGRREPRRRPRRAAPWTSAAAIAGRRATCWRRAIRSTRSRTSAGRGRSRPATSCPPSWRASESPAPANGARLRIGPYTADLDACRLRVDPAASGRQPLQDGRPHRGPGAGPRRRRRPSRRSRSSSDRFVEGALVAIDNRTGQIKAMVGGLDFGRSKFNRAVQAFRQLGSTFKPIVYTAAIDRGYTPASVIVDEPVVYPVGKRRALQPAELRSQVRGPGHVAARRSSSRATSRRSR